MLYREAKLEPGTEIDVNQETLRELAEELIRERVKDIDKRDAFEFLKREGVLAQGRESVELADKANKAKLTITWES